MDYLEKSTKNYIIAAKFNNSIQKIIDQSNNWILLNDGIQICEQNYQAQSWEKPRRMVVVRQKIKERPNAPAKMLSLFPEDEIHKSYRYSAYFTNLEFAPAEIWRMYRGRGDAENRPERQRTGEAVKELKYDFGFDSFNLNGFFPTEATLIFAMIAYNLMSLFRTFVLQQKTQKTLTTL